MSLRSIRFPRLVVAACLAVLAPVALAPSAFAQKKDAAAAKPAAF